MRRGEALGQTDLRSGGCFIGLDVGVGRLEGEFLNKFRVLADGVVDAEAGAHYRVLRGSHGNANARRKVVALGVDQVARILAGVRTNASGKNRGHGSEVIPGIQG